MSRITATFYNLMMSNIERRCLRTWRTELLADVSGDVLEIGAGTGLALSCYPQSVQHLTLAEPDQHMRSQLQKAVAQQPIPATILNASGEQLQLSSGRFDAVVFCLVLCSVSDPLQVLAEAYRLLKPSGRLYFMEHVAAPTDSPRLLWQQRLEPFWKRLAGNCHLTRRTEQLISHSGFHFEQLLRQDMHPAPVFVRPTIRGTARKLL